MPDISNLSVSELKTLQLEANALIEVKTERAILDAYEQINAIASNLNLSVEAILEYGAAKPKKHTPKPVEPRYRNNSNSDETWTGRGKRPRWLVAKINNGAKLEDFLI